MTPVRGPGRSLVVLAKEPRPGRVKTRLAREIGPIDAAWWFRHQLARLLRRVGHDPRWRTVVALAPDTAVPSRALPPAMRQMPQGPGDLGARMARALAAQPPGPALLVGSDIPGISAAQIARAFAVLARHDAVLGPAEDGGFWAIGLKRGGVAVPAGMFAGARWSTAHAFDDTLASLAPLSVGLADRLGDVDSLADLTRLAEPVGRQVP